MKYNSKPLLCAARMSILSISWVDVNSCFKGLRYDNILNILFIRLLFC